MGTLLGPLLAHEVSSVAHYRLWGNCGAEQNMPGYIAIAQACFVGPSLVMACEYMRIYVCGLGCKVKGFSLWLVVRNLKDLVPAQHDLHPV